MLKQIIETKRKELKELVQPNEINVLRKSLYKALATPKRSIGLISEVKKASPSKGVIREDFHPELIAKGYEEGGADALSVLTDQVYFQGHRDYLSAIKQLVDLPILRKDFIIHPIQIEESVRMGADAILLIAGVMPNKDLKRLYEEATATGLECLVEVHEKEELESLLELFTPAIIGVNNRNLKTFTTDLTQTELIGELVPKESLFVSESGIHTYEDLQKVRNAGANAVLVGESLMKADTPQKGIQTLFGGESVEATS
ncbi:indole-3-glycerol phosphate synthase TrpC [Alkalihalophilus sp. As8PL]|uniref:Indole-3-glycerol phosphate synthase n=1 Tax=Alkalihalophilus sp. As8PL TaxID=3237103 RepID=A0AB39BTU2_9BACI